MSARSTFALQGGLLLPCQLSPKGLRLAPLVPSHYGIMLPQLETLLPRGGVHILTTFLVSLVLLPTLFHSSVSLLSLSPTSLSPSSDLHQAAKHALLESKNARKRSWIITGASSALMTLGSLPFVWDFVRGGMDVAKVGRREELAQGLTAFFLAYLAVVSRACLVGARAGADECLGLCGRVEVL